jgi:4-amino-4-deoxy-L-arabinose transferase-like glycosyltransferase
MRPADLPTPGVLRRNPVALGLLLIVCLSAWLASAIPQGTLANTDELLTAERSREMLLLGRSEIHLNFKPSFEKPPLQYWLTALTLPRLKNRTLAVRIWPMIYGVLTAFALLWLALVVDPNRPWVGPLSVVILFSCSLFAIEVSRALLDIGLALFTTSAILFAQLARKHPPWWLGVGIACWLGSLQKVPLILLFWLLMLIVRFSSKTERPSLRSGWLIASVLGSLVAVAAWPVFQILRYNMPFWSVFHQEVIVWLGPKNLGARPYLEIPYRLIITSASGFLLLLAPLAILFWRKQDFSVAVKEIAIVCLSFTGLAIISNFRSARYMVPIVPVLCLLLAVVFRRVLQRARHPPIWGAALAVLLLAGFIHTRITVVLRRKNVADQLRVARELGARQQQGTRLVLIKPDDTGAGLLYDDFYLFHGNLRFPIERYSVKQIQHGPVPPITGVCRARDFGAVLKAYPRAQVQFTQAQFLLWHVD